MEVEGWRFTKTNSAPGNNVSGCVLCLQKLQRKSSSDKGVKNGPEKRLINSLPVFSPIASANTSSTLCRKGGTTCTTARSLGRSALRDVQKICRGEGETAVRNTGKKSLMNAVRVGASEGFSYGKEGNFLGTCSHLATTSQERILKYVSLL